MLGTLPAYYNSVSPMTISSQMIKMRCKDVEGTTKVVWIKKYLDQKRMQSKDFDGRIFRLLSETQLASVEHLHVLEGLEYSLAGYLLRTYSLHPSCHGTLCCFLYRCVWAWDKQIWPRRSISIVSHKRLTWRYSLYYHRAFISSYLTLERKSNVCLRTCWLWAWTHYLYAFSGVVNIPNNLLITITCKWEGMADITITAPHLVFLLSNFFFSCNFPIEV